jgi:hypothetical protein
MANNRFNATEGAVKRQITESSGISELLRDAGQNGARRKEHQAEMS